jgi:hypothetical protein
LIFTFKSYPIFMAEMIYTLHKQSPQAGVFMLMSLVAMAGTQGLPFAEDIQDLIDTIAQRLFGSPFNSKRAIHNILKTASEASVGMDLSGVMMNGLVNSMTNLSFASRVGLGNIIPGTRMFTADATFKDVTKEVAGPIASVLEGYYKGAIEISQGDFLAAGKAALPLAMQNVIKGWEQAQLGYSTDAAGRKIAEVSDVGALMQAVGFSSATASAAYSLDRMDKESRAFYKEMSQDYTTQIVKALKRNDTEAVNSLFQSLYRWNEKHPEMAIVINGPSLRQKVVEAGLPLNQRTLSQLPKTMRGSSVAAEVVSGQ